MKGFALVPKFWKWGCWEVGKGQVNQVARTAKNIATFSDQNKVYSSGSNLNKEIELFNTLLLEF